MRFKLSDYRGKVVMIAFWATWCSPCMKLIPHERELVTRLADKPFAIVGVNGDVDAQRIAQAVDTHEITWRSFHDERPGNHSISEEWNPPTTTQSLVTR